MYTINQDLLRELCSAYAPSGNETKVRELIQDEIKDYVDEIYTDPLGNLVARKKGAGKKLMLAAHMDQIGLMVTFIDEKGFLRFTNVGGISPTVSLAQRVIFENEIIGVIGSEPVDSPKDLKLDKLFIDIGATSKEEAEKLVSIGDVAVYEGEVILDNRRVVSPALDDRIGCFILIESLKNMKNNGHDLYFVFTTQEELGMRGAKTAAYGVDPDFGIALDVTATGDTPKAKTMAVSLGNGPAIKVKDNSILCHPTVKNYMVEQAKHYQIPYQLEVLEHGGTDSGAIHLSKSGVPSGVLSIPTRYLHSTCEMCMLSDIVHCVELTIKLVENQIS